MAQRRFHSLIFALCASLPLAACGGGSGEPPPSPSPGPATTACDTATGPKRFVGPGKAYPTIRAAAQAAASGDVVVISAGDYVGDVATWAQSNLTICGAGGRARLFAAGRNEGGKGIWVIRGSNVVVDSVEFHDAKVPDQNGAGIRAEGSGLAIVNAGFFDNENGILGPDTGEITITRSEFARNGFGDGQSHNVYIGAAARLSVSASYFHEAKIGHNLKSRARETRIENSYFTNGPNGTASYDIEFPDGGLVTLRGNLVQKGPKADNSTLVSYGAERRNSWPVNTLTMVHNTLVSIYPGGSFVHVAPFVTSVISTANLFAGSGTGVPRYSAGLGSKLVETNNVVSTNGNFTGADNVANPNFWPAPTLANSIVVNTVPDPTYLHDAPRPTVLRPIDATASTRRVGALQSPP